MVGNPQTITPYGDELFMSISTVVASAWRNYTSCVFGKGIVSRSLMDLMIYGTVRIHF